MCFYGHIDLLPLLHSLISAPDRPTREPNTYWRAHCTCFHLPPLACFAATRHSCLYELNLLLFLHHFNCCHCGGDSSSAAHSILSLSTGTHPLESIRLWCVPQCAFLVGLPSTGKYHPTIFFYFTILPSLTR